MIQQVTRATCDGCGEVRYVEPTAPLLRRPEPLPAFWSVVYDRPELTPHTYCPKCNLEAFEKAELT